MVILKPVKEGAADYVELESEIQAVFDQEIYNPLAGLLQLNKNILMNSMEDLIKAIKSGKIYFYRGSFDGKFNAQITKELKKLGAKWVDGKFKLSVGDLPNEIRTAITLSDLRFEQMVTSIDRLLDRVLPESVAFQRIFDTTILKTEARIQKTLPKSIVIEKKLTKDDISRISQDYTNNMNKYIQGWTEQEIVKLRKDIKDRVMRGERYEGVIKSIQHSYQVSKSKAKFLARQETNLLTSKLKEMRYTDAGSKGYIWETVVGSPSHPVRPMHKALKGKFFLWNNPPVTSPDGRRNHPGEDFNCRCFARPVIK